MQGPKWPFLLRYGSHDTRRIDFPRVDGLSTDTPDLGRHIDHYLSTNQLTNKIIYIQIYETVSKELLSNPR